ncbi:hypothetical protein [Rhizobium leguminosarum]|nr:hypothetical protein [Rhizobium leguminosarum]
MIRFIPTLAALEERQAAFARPPLPQSGSDARKIHFCLGMTPRRTMIGQ